MPVYSLSLKVDKSQIKLKTLFIKDTNYVSDPAYHALRGIAPTMPTLCSIVKLRDTINDFVQIEHIKEVIIKASLNKLSFSPYKTIIN